MKYSFLLLAAGSVALVASACAPFPPPPPGPPPPPPYPMRGYPAAYPPPPPDWMQTRSNGEIDFTLSDEVLFAFDSSELSPRASDSIDRVARELKRHRRGTIYVDGYTDTVGSASYNMSLSQARAGAVAEALSRDGIDQGRIHARGFGKTHLAVPTGDNVRERRNRRVVVRLMPDRRW